MIRFKFIKDCSDENEGLFPFFFEKDHAAGSSDFPDDLRQITDGFLRLPVTSSERSIQPIGGVSNHNTLFVIQIS